MHTVPTSVRKTAQEALALVKGDAQHRATGIRIAEALVTGEVDTATLQRIVRYHRVHDRTNTILERDLFRLPAECPELLSRELRGGGGGAAWAATTLDKLEEQGVYVADPVLELFEASPEEVYAKFALGAWRFTYGLTPRKAVRFLEHYAEATGQWLDLQRAFGDSAKYVNGAVFEKYRPKNTMQQALGEALVWPSVSGLPDIAYAKKTYAGFMAYVALAAEDPKALSELISVSRVLTPIGSKLASAISYSDADYFFLSTYHPDGKRYTPIVADSDEDTVRKRIYAGLQKIHKGYPLTRQGALGIINDIGMRVYADKAGYAIWTSLRNKVKARQWAELEADIDPDHDVLSYFQTSSVGTKQPNATLAVTTPPVAAVRVTVPAPAPAPAPAAPDGISGMVLSYLQKEYGADNVSKFTAIPLTDTASVKWVDLKTQELKPGWTLRNKKNGGIFRFIQAVRIAGTFVTDDGEVEVDDTILVYIDDDAGYGHLDDDTILQALKAGKLQVLNGEATHDTVPVAPAPVKFIAPAPASAPPVLVTVPVPVPAPVESSEVSDSDLIVGDLVTYAHAFGTHLVVTPFPELRLTLWCPLQPKADLPLVTPSATKFTKRGNSMQSEMAALNMLLDAPLHDAAYMSKYAVSTSIPTTWKVELGQRVAYSGTRGRLLGALTLIGPSPRTAPVFLEAGAAPDAYPLRPVIRDDVYFDHTLLLSYDPGAPIPSTTPKNAPFLPKTVVENDGVKYTLVGYQPNVQGTVLAVLQPSNLNAKPAFVSLDDLATFHGVFVHDTVFGPDSLGLTFSKNKGADELTLNGPGVSTPSSLLSDWDIPAGVAQPALPPLAAGQRLSAGIVALVLPGAVVGTKMKSLGLAHPGVVMVYPLNGFGGYILSFPKGKVDAGESLLRAAVREVYEETGCSVRPHAYLGDYQSQGSITRMFIGVLVGGDPRKAGRETDAVALKLLKDFETFSNTPYTGVDEEERLNLCQTYVNTLTWKSLLSARDREVVRDTARWLWERGFEGLSAPQPVKSPSSPVVTTFDLGQAVTFVQGSQNSQTGLYPKQVDAVIDYVISAADSKAIGQTAFGGNNLSWGAWRWASAGAYLKQGYPVPNTSVVATGSETVDKSKDSVIRVIGYIETANTSFDKESAPHHFLVYEHKGVVALYYLPMPSEDAQLAFTAVTTRAPDTTHVSESSPVAGVWNSLYYGETVPLSQHAVSSLRRFALSTELAIAQVSSVDNELSNIGYGFLSEGKHYVYMGAFVMKTESGSIYRVYLGVDEDGDYVVFPSYKFGGNPPIKDEQHTAKFATSTPWLVSPHPVVNAAFQAYHTTGKFPGVVTMSVLKTSFLPSCGLANHSYFTDELSDVVAACFVPGAVTYPVYAALVSCLARRAKMAGQATPIGVVAPAAASPPPVVVLPPAAWDDATVLAHVLDPALTKWTVTSQSLAGGSKPNRVVTDAAGVKYLWKPAAQSFGASAGRAAFTIAAQVKGNNVPVGILQQGAESGSIQPILPDAKELLESDYANLSDTDKSEILSQHMVDMYVSNHDGHPGNWLRVGGGLLSIDHDQTFKFISNDSYDPAWMAPGNYGVPTAKHLLSAWAKGTTELPASVFAAMFATIKNIQQLTDVDLIKVAAVALEGYPKDHALATTLWPLLKKRRDSFHADWVKVLKGLAAARGEKFVVPGAAKKAKKATIPKDLTEAGKALKFTSAEVEDIAVAAASGLHGKSLQIDGPAFENQEVVVKEVRYKSKEGTDDTATLIHFRISRASGLQAAAVLKKKAKVVTSVTGGPAPLIIDSYWAVLRAGVGTVNQHMSPEGTKDGIPNAKKIEDVKALVEALETIKQQTTSPKGTYLVVSNVAAQQMASNYLQYAASILAAAAQAPKVFDSKIEQFYQFVWSEPVVAQKEEEETDNDYKITYTANSGAWPTTQAVVGKLSVQSVDSPFYLPDGNSGGSQQPQFKIEVVAIPGARVYWNPPPATYSDASIRTHIGQGWGVIPGKASAATVATLLKAFENATGLSCAVATPQDKEVLYLAKQAYVLQGTATPSSDGQGGVAPQLVSGLAAYAVGDAAGAIKTLQEYVASASGTSVVAMKSDPTYNPAPSFAGGKGQHVHLRYGWDRKRLQSYLGADVYLAHRVTTNGIVSFLSLVLPASGSLVANAIRPFYGLPVSSASGSSVSSDFKVGGSANVFTAMRRAPSFYSGHLYFDISLALRTDVYVTGTGDGYGGEYQSAGGATNKRLLTPESWKEKDYHKEKGPVSSGTSGQFTVRNRIDLREYLRYAVFDLESERVAALAVCEAHGWTKTAFGDSLKNAFIVA